jgi:hypothetical protein
MVSLTCRMLPANVSGGTVTAYAGGPNPADPSRRYYSASPGSFVDVSGPAGDGDAAMVASQGFLPVCSSGTTALRLQLTGVFFKAGQLFLDTTLGLVILFDGVTWRNPVTGAAV